MKRILYKKSVSYRNPPQNLETKELNLFEHEFKKEIKSSYIFFEKNIYAINTVFFSIHKFSYFNDYSFFGDKTFIERIKRVLKNIIRSSKKTELINKGAWIVDNKSHVYFHWIFDALERSELVTKDLKDYPLLIPEEFYEKNFVAESLKHLKLNYIVLRKNQIYKIKELLITSKTAMSGNYNETILRSLIDRFKNNFEYKSIPKKENIFIYRDSKIGRDIENFIDIKPILDKHNYEIVDFEKYSFSEKISLLQGCKNLLGLFGSGLSNMIFLNKGNNLIEIRNENDDKNNAFFTLASACSLNYYYLFFKINEKGCYVDPSVLDNLLKKLK
tara:strand:+ start:1090 stop:2079 length:990 start_codon:yes stop_codon:yes gene_type:complete